MVDHETQSIEYVSEHCLGIKNIHEGVHIITGDKLYNALSAVYLISKQIGITQSNSRYRRVDDRTR